MAKAISLVEARAQVLASFCASQGAASRSVEMVALEQAHGRFLAKSMHAAGPWPATDRSAMDGFAVHAGSAGLAAGTVLPVVGESLAGTPFGRAVAAGEAIRIMTGAVVPSGADAVVQVEHTSGFAGANVTLQQAVRGGQNVRRLGSEVAAGQLVLSAGCRIGAAQIGALAVLGVATVPVFTKVVVAIVATGDEVVPVTNEPAPHQVRESNSWALAAQVHEVGARGVRLGIAPDSEPELRAMLQRGLDSADVLITIGGVSKGTHDLVHGTLQGLGVREQFHGIDLKPGKPTFFGVRERATGPQFVFGLPGNPASSFTVFDLLVRPLLLAMVGADPGELGAQLPHGGAPWQPNARLQAVPARLVAGPAGALQAELVPPSPSGDPFSLLRGEVYALIPGQLSAGGTSTVAIAGGSRGVVLP
ncbi:MAG: molybdopterin molybdotransferase MoeA [Planctomycetes bacterium]|jgi:molybdopterin molybdotransferase|nr:molybdopterin molybdotransferase MoeA [Planctomycetota bacterium]